MRSVSVTKSQRNYIEPVIIRSLNLSITCQDHQIWINVGKIHPLVGHFFSEKLQGFVVRWLLVAHLGFQ